VTPEGGFHLVFPILGGLTKQLPLKLGVGAKTVSAITPTAGGGPADAISKGVLQVDIRRVRKRDSDATAGVAVRTVFSNC
jgi:hypothetical protein